MAQQGRYTGVAQILHWLIAGLIVVQFVLAELAEEAEHAGALMQQLALLANHKSVGMTVLGLALLRLAWRGTHTPPALPAGMPGWQRRASHVSHGLLYVLLFALPISGWLMSSASAYTVSWFNLFSIPDLVAPDPELKETLEQVHEALGQALFLIACIHIAAALKHAVLDRDGVLARMSSVSSVVIGCVAVLAGLMLLLPDDSGAARVATADTPAVVENIADETALGDNDIESNDIASWHIDYAQSHIEFTAEQAGAEFTGTWPTWEADIRFDPTRLADSGAVVRISVAAIDTRDDERDATLVGAEFFDAGGYPEVVFRALRFAATPTGFTADGELRVKGAATPVTFDFGVTQTESGGRLLQGTARLDRLALKVGTGDWASTEWVGQFVDVHVQVTAAGP